MLLDPRQEPSMKAEAKAAKIVEDEVNIKQ